VRVEAGGARKRVAVMQPYFFPYAGYFRLLAVVDEFVVFDCVQFPRRGRVHRTEVPGPSGGVEWLTLPLARQLRTVLIRDLAFAADARARLDERLQRHGWIGAGHTPAAPALRGYLHGPLESVSDFVVDGLRLVVDILDLGVKITRSSDLGLDAALRGQDRVIDVARAVGATEYLNAPGGRRLYQADRFARDGIELLFLPPYTGRYVHLLPALMTESATAIREDVLASARL
jgi:hypothetical protein